MSKKSTPKWEYLIIFIYFTLFLAVGISMVLKQPFGNPPDEHTKYLIPAYISQVGSLPNGYDEAIRIPGYGISYAFFPILPCIAQGLFMRFVFIFNKGFLASLYAARFVNLFFGLITAIFVLLLAKGWFSDKRIQYLFAFLVTFLPQSLFLHTYINNDSCCMMSIAIMLYGLTKGFKEHFSYGSCIWLSLGIILCALSYYNAYGFILSCILLFFAYYLYYQNSKPTFQWKPFLSKGIFISILVLMGISWWFIRSYILYDGDILGLKSMTECSYLYGDPALHPDKRVTYKSLGYNLFTMIFHSDFWELSINSFIAVFGATSITTSIWIYRFFKLLFPAGILGCILTIFARKDYPDTMHRNRPAFCVFYHCNMIFCIAMPCILSIYYSYAMDKQPQGRYLMPALIPLCYYCIRGIQKIYLLIIDWMQNKKPAKTVLVNRVFTGLCVVLCSIIVICLLVTVYGYAFPYYEAHPIA